MPALQAKQQQVDMQPEAAELDKLAAQTATVVVVTVYDILEHFTEVVAAEHNRVADF
jgi:hypothetical protein